MAKVLCVIRNLAALDRFHDIVPALANDTRLRFRFTIAAGSNFTHDLHKAMAELGIRVLDWQTARQEEFHLALTTSSNGDLHELGVPLLLLSHGAGFHKMRPTDDGFTGEITGLSRAQLMRDDAVTPDTVGLSHPDQLAQLRRSCPEALDRARVLGDPCFDRLRASLPMRETYRRALGCEHRRLVLVTSTWGPGSLFSEGGDLVERLTSQLPENYATALVLHPDIWDWHSEWDIRMWTRRAQQHGLILIPPDRGWRAAVVASDVVLADNGSVGFYAACLGKPTALGAFPREQIAPGTAMERFGELAQRWEHTAGVREQIEAIRPIPGYESLAAGVFAHPGRSAALIRTAVYERLGLDEPGWPVYAEPVEVFSPSTAW